MSDKDKLKNLVRQKQKGLGRKKRQRKLKPTKPTKALEVEYRGLAVKGLNVLHKEVLQVLRPILGKKSNRVIVDSANDELLVAFKNFKKTATEVNKTAGSTANKIVRKANKLNKQRYYRSLRNMFGVDLGSVVNEEGISDILQIATNENVNLIKSIPVDYLADVEKLVYRNVLQGTDKKSLIEQLNGLHDKGVNRSKLIARDQTAKLNANMNRFRNQNLGITHYIWRTAGDGDRVRPSHRANNGKRFAWTDPPNTGHPGEDIQCRCIAEPVIEL